MYLGYFEAVTIIYYYIVDFSILALKFTLKKPPAFFSSTDMLFTRKLITKINGNPILGRIRTSLELIDFREFHHA